MKCLLFIITLCSIGGFIDAQGENYEDSNLSGIDPAYNDLTEDRPPDELEQSTYDDRYKYKYNEDFSKAESLEQERRVKKKEIKLSGDLNSSNNDRKKQKQHEQGGNNAHYDWPENYPLSHDITEDNTPDESEQSSEDSEQSTNDGSDFKYNVEVSKAESLEQERREKKREIIPSGDLNSSKNVRKKQKQHEDTMKRFLTEMAAGDQADLIGQNQHKEQSHYFNNLGRRSVAQAMKNIAAENADYLTPEKAPPELVLLVAKESALLRAGKDTDLGSDFDRKKLLRSGDYWNGVWKEKVKPKSAMRSASQKKKLGSIKAKINPGTELHKVVSQMKKISPQLLFIINKQH